jgi:hypothetical protein
MKQYIIILCALLAFTACSEFENSAEGSKTTYLPFVVMNGDAEIDLECDATGFVDDGCTMSEGGVELEVTTTNYGLYFDGSYDLDGNWIYNNSAISGPDLYDVSYSALNKDGIPGVAARSVYWPECNGDMVTSIAGMYKMTVARNGSTPVGYSDNGPFFIKDLGSNVYALPDGMGGWYEHGRGFGPYDGPALGMQVTANDIPTNDFTYGPTFTIPVFGGAVDIEAFSVDPVAKTITFQTYWDFGYTFDVVLTQCPDGVKCWE